MDRDDEAFLDELGRRCFEFFMEQADPTTGLIADRALADGSGKFDVASIAATGFGLTALCIGDERGWIESDRAYQRVLTTLRFIWEKMPHENGFYYHFVDMKTGERVWDCELSSIDTGLLLAGVLTARQYYKGTEVEDLATKIYDRVDWPWMRGAGKTLTMGWTPENGFLHATWDGYSEHTIIYLMGLGSNTHPLPPEAWRTWKREPVITYDGLTFMACPPLFTHQFSHAFIDYRDKRDGVADYYRNSVLATRAHRQMCIKLAKRFPHFSEDLWGITASDYVGGYTAWGGPPATPNIDGTVVPCAAAGSIPFLPDETIRTLRYMKKTYGDRVWKHYGFVDAFNPQTGYTADQVIGIDVGITLMMIENYRTGFVWEHFMDNPEVQEAMKLAGFVSTDQRLPDEDVAYLRQLAADTWNSISLTVDQETGLPRDRVDGGQATSVSNIGMYLASVAVAKHMGLIDEAEAVERIDRCLTSLEALPTTHGFQQSWHHADTLEPLDADPWISVLDTGNLIGGLLAVAQAYPRFRERCDRLVNAMDWSTFYDKQSGRLLGGYNVAEQRTNPDWKLDLLGSDARLAQFIAVAADGAPAEMWDTLDRNTESRHGARYLEPGWQGGGLFMQYINGLFLDERGTLMGRSAENFAYAQIRHAQENGYPVWGWSASAAPDGKYLGWGALVDEVVTPHASVLAINAFPGEVVANLRRMEAMGARPGDMGFVDSLHIRDGSLSDQYLVLDQGMLFLSLANYLEDDVLRRWFGSHPLAQRGYGAIREYRNRSYGENNSVYDLGKPMTAGQLAARWNKGNRTARVRPMSFGWEQADWHAVTAEDSLEKGRPREDNEASARFAFAWDEQALHVVVRVVDGQVVNTSDPDRLHEQDCVEWYIDPQDDGLVWGSDKDFQFGFAVTDKAWEWFGNRHEKIQQAVTKTDDGYEVRAAIPWQVLGVTPTAGLKIQSSVAVRSVNARGDSSMKLNWRFNEQAGRIRLGELVLE